MHGICVSGKCSCFPGFLSDAKQNINDCSLTIPKDYRFDWDFARGLCAAIYAILAIISFTGAYYGVSITKLSQISKSSDHSGNNISNERKVLAPVVNIRRAVLIAVGFLAISQFLYLAIDPSGVYGIINPLLNSFLFGPQWYLGIFAYASILFHWIDIYNVSVSSIRTENMLVSINQNYKGKQITLEQMVEKVNFLKKLRIPFICVVVSVFALHVISNFVVYYAKEYVIILVFIYYTEGVWILLTLGFIFYGRRLVSLMPPNLLKRVRKLTTKVTILSCIKILSFVLYTIFSYSTKNSVNPEIFMALGLSGYYFVLLESFAMVMVFAKFNSRFPFLFVSGGGDSMSSKNDSKNEGSKSFA